MPDDNPPPPLAEPITSERAAVAVRRRAGRRRGRAETLLAIAAGGACGTLARVELERVLPAGPGLPWGTFAVNVAGSLLLGLGAVLLLERVGPSRYAGPLFATGFCGSFTTFSTFAVEVDLRLRSGAVAGGLGYALASLAAGLAAMIGGIALGHGILRRELLGGTNESASGGRR